MIAALTGYNIGADYFLPWRLFKEDYTRSFVTFTKTGKIIEDISKALSDNLKISVENLEADKSYTEVEEFVKGNSLMRFLSAEKLNIRFLRLIKNNLKDDIKIMDTVLFKRTGIPTLCIMNEAMLKDMGTEDIMENGVKIGESLKTSSKVGISAVVDLNDCNSRLNNLGFWAEFLLELIVSTTILLSSKGARKFLAVRLKSILD